MNLNELRTDIARKSKKGASFILASVLIWTGVLVIWLLPGNSVQMRNLLTFCCTAPLMPIAYLISRIIKADFSVKDNPLNKLGLLFTMNQMLYLLIAMWAFAAAPDKMVMILAIVFGAHLLPYSWLYQSRAYLVMSIVITLTAAILGWTTNNVLLIPSVMIAFEAGFGLWLMIEVKRLPL